MVFYDKTYSNFENPYRNVKAVVHQITWLMRLNDKYGIYVKSSSIHF